MQQATFYLGCLLQKAGNIRNRFTKSKARKLYFKYLNKTWKADPGLDVINPVKLQRVCVCVCVCVCVRLHVSVYVCMVTRAHTLAPFGKHPQVLQACSHTQMAIASAICHLFTPRAVKHVDVTRKYILQSALSKGQMTNNYISKVGNTVCIFQAMLVKGSLEHKYRDSASVRGGFSQQDTPKRQLLPEKDCEALS